MSATSSERSAAKAAWTIQIGAEGMNGPAGRIQRYATPGRETSRWMTPSCAGTPEFGVKCHALFTSTETRC